MNEEHLKVDPTTSEITGSIGLLCHDIFGCHWNKIRLISSQRFDKVISCLKEPVVVSFLKYSPQYVIWYTLWKVSRKNHLTCNFLQNSILYICCLTFFTRLEFVELLKNVHKFGHIIDGSNTIVCEGCYVFQGNTRKGQLW